MGSQIVIHIFYLCKHCLQNAAKCTTTVFFALYCNVTRPADSADKVIVVSGHCQLVV